MWRWRDRNSWRKCIQSGEMLSNCNFIVASNANPPTGPFHKKIVQFRRLFVQVVAVIDVERVPEAKLFPQSADWLRMWKKCRILFVLCFSVVTGSAHDRRSNFLFCCHPSSPRPTVFVCSSSMFNYFFRSPPRSEEKVARKALTIRVSCMKKASWIRSKVPVYRSDLEEKIEKSQIEGDTRAKSSENFQKAIICLISDNQKAP